MQSFGIFARTGNETLGGRGKAREFVFVVDNCIFNAILFSCIVVNNQIADICLLKSLIQTNKKSQIFRSKTILVSML